MDSFYEMIRTSIVIDDKYDEVQTLIEVLNKNSSSTLYINPFKASECNITYFRAVFLDLDYGPGSNKIKDSVNALRTLVDNDLAKENVYILFFWTTHSDMVEQVKEEIEKKVNNKPILSADLDKTVLYELNEPDFKKLLREKMSILSNNSLYKMFSIDKVFQNTSSSFLRELSCRFPCDDELGTMLKNLPTMYGHRQKYKKTLSSLNPLIVDCYKRIVSKSTFQTNFKKNTDLTDEIKAKANFMLHFNLFIDEKLPGEFYKYSGDVTMFLNKIIKNKADNVMQEFNGIKIIQVDMTPYCDVKKKYGYLTVKGVIIRNSDFEKIQKRTNLYIDYGPYFIESNLVKILFFPHSISNNDLTESVKHHLQFTKELNNDLQNQISAFLARPGILNLD
jgi:hypothetical protein